MRQRGRIDLVRDKVLEFARVLRRDDEVVLEATGNTITGGPGFRVTVISPLPRARARA